ncbi:unnamed protein product [Cylicocyclus nassatus]|uniref:Uncharacterized protein n=1 Tax=Cylicocyclus nassatus TaxID=53992 RepID=A0AA36HE74_CYLNA|nr:unnamed protein product [Cylicocyclus nassatus]
MSEKQKEHGSTSFLNLTSSRRKGHRHRATRREKYSKSKVHRKTSKSTSTHRKKKIDRSTSQRKEIKEQRKASRESKLSVRGNIMATSLKIRKTLIKSVKSAVAKKPDLADNLSPTQHEDVEKDDEEKEGGEEKALEEERERVAQAKKDCDIARAMEREYTLFEKTAAPTRPALVVEPPANITCDGKPINATAGRRVESRDSRVERIDKSPKGDMPLVVDSNPGAQG